MKYITFLLTVASLSVAMAAPQPGCDFPVPNYKIAVHAGTGITEDQYTKVLDKVQEAYDPVFADIGKSLNIERSWDDGTVNAQAWWSWDKKTCNIEMFGGLARFSGVTAAGFRQVALHEIGHCLGGEPLYPRSDLSAEGQADFYSTSVGCDLMDVACKASSLNLARLLATLNKDVPPVRPSPPLPEVKDTYLKHPDAQCRLNTYDAGRLELERPRCWYKP